MFGRYLLSTSYVIYSVDSEQKNNKPTCYSFVHSHSI